LEAYLKVMQEIDQDELVNALEEIINLFEDKVAPYAYELIEEVNNRFKKIAKSSQDAMCESILTGNACLSTIRTIISAVSKDKELLERVEELLYPTILFCLTPRGVEFTNECLDLPALFVYHRKFVSEKMWKIFFHQFKIAIGDENDEDEAVEGAFGFEFIPIMMSFFQNCVSFGGDAFLTHIIDDETPVQLYTKSIKRIIEIERNMGAEIFTTSV